MSAALTTSAAGIRRHEVAHRPRPLLFEFYILRSGPGHRRPPRGNRRRGAHAAPAGAPRKAQGHPEGASFDRRRGSTRDAGRCRASPLRWRGLGFLGGQMAEEFAVVRVGKRGAAPASACGPLAVSANRWERRSVTVRNRRDTSVFAMRRSASLEIAPRVMTQPLGERARRHLLLVEQRAQHDPFGDGHPACGDLQAERVRDRIGDEAKPRKPRCAGERADIVRPGGEASRRGLGRGLAPGNRSTYVSAGPSIVGRPAAGERRRNSRRSPKPRCGRRIRDT